MSDDWKKYEKVARILLLHLRTELGLDRVEGKQKLVGLQSGTEWEVDAKGVREAGDGYLLVECRRYTTSRLTQEDLAAFAWRVTDTGAVGGITVSPLPIQSGAKKIATAANIVHVEIDANSTPENFAMRFLNQVMLGITDRFEVRAEVTMHVSRTCECGTKFDPDLHSACPACGKEGRKKPTSP